MLKLWGFNTLTKRKGWVSTPENGGAQTLAQVLAAGNDGDQVGLTNTGLIDTGGGNVTANVVSGAVVDGVVINLDGTPLPDAFLAQGGPLTEALDAAGQDITNVQTLTGTGDGDWDTGGGNLALGGADITGVSDLGMTGNITGAGHITMDGDLSGFLTATPASPPEVPATPTEQDIVDALVTLGLVTQAAP